MVPVFSLVCPALFCRIHPYFPLPVFVLYRPSSLYPCVSLAHYPLCILVLFFSSLFVSISVFKLLFIGILHLFYPYSEKVNISFYAVYMAN